MFCKKCGRQIASVRICPYCKSAQWQDEAQLLDFSEKRFSFEHAASEGRRSRVLAGILQLFMGMLGIGRLYLGYQKQAMLQILVSIVTGGIGGVIWGIIDGVLILDGKIPYNAEGKRLV